MNRLCNSKATGLNKTLFILGKANSHVCAHCNLTESQEHEVMHFVTIMKKGTSDYNGIFQGK